MMNAHALLKRLLLLPLLCLATLSVASQINVSPLSLDFTLKGPRFADIIVSNTGDDMAYVKVTLTRVDHPGTPQEKSIAMNNNPEAFGLMVSPDRLAIPAKQLRHVRVLPLVKGNTEDVYYKVNVTPVSGELQSLLSPDKAIAAGVQIIVGYEVKVFVRPVQATGVLSINRLANQVTIKNTGNSNVLLYQGQQCDVSHPPHCTPLTTPAHRVFPGETWTFMLGNPAPVQFTESFLDKTQTVTSN